MKPAGGVRLDRAGETRHNMKKIYSPGRANANRQAGRARALALETAPERRSADLRRPLQVLHNPPCDDLRHDLV
jgi:hypothetical protein